MQKQNKFFNNILKCLTIILVINTITFANEENFELAKVNYKDLELFKEPSQTSKRIANKYKFHDSIKVYGCDKYQWCKVDGGYVKQHLLKFETLKEVLKQNGIISVINPNKVLKSHWNNNKMFYRISVNESVLDILTAIAVQNGSQIIFEKGIDGVETLTIDDMPLEGAFDLLLQRNNLEYKWEKNTIIVNSVKNTKIKKEFLILKNITIEKLITLLKRYNIYTKVKNKVIFDKEMNAVYIEAQDEVIKDFQNILIRFETAEKLLRETRIKRTKEDIEYKKLESINKKQISIMKKKKKYGLDEYDDWKMVLEIIPLKYINVSAKEIEFQGEKIQVESLEDTLKGLLGTGYVANNININNADSNLSKRFLLQSNLHKEKTYLKIDSRTNSIIVKDFPDRIEEIKRIINKLDKPSKLIEIEVTIATGTTGFTNKLGLALGGVQTNNNRSYGYSTSAGAAGVINDSLNGKNTNLLQPSGALGLSGSMIFAGSKNIINTQLNIMEEEGLGKVLSNPRMVTMNNREATIISGESISIPVATDKAISLETVKTGISIKSTPHIIEKDNDKLKDIMLDISIESSSLGDTTGNKINKKTNKINTNIIIRNGQTLILGGLFQYTQSDTDGGVPILKDIPLLGFLFSTKTKLLNKSELVFFITPKIITSEMLNNNAQMHYKKSLEKEKKSFNKLQNKENIILDKKVHNIKNIKTKKEENFDILETNDNLVNQILGIE